MALHKLSKPKTFHVEYCGCKEATLLLNEPVIKDTIDFIRQTKTKRDFVKTTVTITKDGIKIVYSNEQNISTFVPLSMVAASSVGKPPLHNTVGIIYISPLTGQHYPAFIHVYRCETSHIAQKFFSRLRSYLLIESHRLEIVRLEEQLLQNNLLNIEQYTARKSQKSNPTSLSTSLTDNNHSRQEPKQDPIKSLTEEFQKKLELHEPILFPPKDYDTIHAAHGNIQRAQAWKSTEPAIVGYSPIDPDENRPRKQIQTNVFTINDEKKTNSNNISMEQTKNERSDESDQAIDPNFDPVETVSIAFDFLKDETSSIFNENDGNVEHLVTSQQNKTPVYRFRPPQMGAITKKLFNRNNNYELTNGVSSRNDLDDYYTNQHYRIQNGNRTRSETHLNYDPQQQQQQQTNLHPSPHYGNRLGNGNGHPISTNPVWISSPSNMAGSQPNLLSPQKSNDVPTHRYPVSPQMDTRIPSAPLQNALYASYPDNKFDMRIKQQQQQQQRPSKIQYQSNKKQATQAQYLDTNEFILRASNGEPLRHHQYPNRYNPRDYRPHSMDMNSTMLDVYY